MKAGNTTAKWSLVAVASCYLFAATYAHADGDEERPLFQPSARCVACHNGIFSRSGKPVSFGHSWAPTMMANSARDPYWQAGVRRETLEHPTKVAEIENECSKCHMPMATVSAHTAGRLGKVFANFTESSERSEAGVALAQDGVSCSLCHQIQPTDLGTRKSLTGGFVIDTASTELPRREFGPKVVDWGRAHLMSSSSQMTPVSAQHLSSSELCATCHTLYTHALDAQGKVIGELPEQVPYQEWQHSSYRGVKSCQSCHMPHVAGPVALSSVAALPRPSLREHHFVGGNAFMLGLFARHGEELTAQAGTQRFELAKAYTREHLQTEPAKLEVKCASTNDKALAVFVTVKNLSGHKLPTAYPSRRVWIHVKAVDDQGTVLFESGALKPNGAIVGNDNDEAELRFEPHHERISSSSEVQIYESILGAPDGRVTTGLLTASRYLKDNRLLPRGFDKSTASSDVAVHGGASVDADFVGGSDTVVYSLSHPEQKKPRVIVELVYQTIGYRWAMNLNGFNAMEPKRFVRMYRELSPDSATVLAQGEYCR